MAKWLGQTNSRAIELGTVIHIHADGEAVPAPLPDTDDMLCIVVSGETCTATVRAASEARITVALVKGPSLALEPVPAGHPAHGEFSAPGVPVSVWRIAKVE